MKTWIVKTPTLPTSVWEICILVLPQAPGYGDVRLSLETIPDTVNLEEPFDITCKITNCSERTMDLVLEMCNTNSIHWCGVSGRQLGKLHPSSSLRLALTLLSSVQGLQSVSGLRLTDTFLKRTYEYDDIAQVCVVSSKVKQESWRKVLFLLFVFFGPTSCVFCS